MKKMILTIIGLAFYTINSVAQISSTTIIPDWYKENRVHLHWEGWYPGPSAEVGFNGSFGQWQKSVHSSHEIIALSGAKATVCVTRHGAEGDWNKSQIQEKPYFYNRKIIKNDIIGDYKAYGLNVIAYHRHDIDYNVQKEHPDWLCKDQFGNFIKKNRGVAYGFDQPYQICINSPYKYIMATNLKEIVLLGAKGIYLDEDHMPEVCFCRNCKAKFREENGFDMPLNPEKGTMEYLKIAKFVGKSLTEAFSLWRQSINIIDPSAMLLVSSSNYTQFTGIHQSEEMAVSGGAIKTEFQKCFGGQQHWPGAPLRKLVTNNPKYYLPKRDLQESVEWMIARDTKEGVPPHIWIWNPDPTVFGEIMHPVVAVVGFGGIASLNISPTQKVLPTLRKVFNFSNMISDEMRDAEPYNWAVIHVSNQLKEKYYLLGGENEDTRYRIQYENFYAPILGIAQALQEEKYPFGIITDDLIMNEKINANTRIIIVPNYESLSNPMKDKLSRLQNAGKKILILDDIKVENKRWYIDSEQSMLRSSFLEKLQKQAGLPPIYTTGPSNVKVSYLYDSKKKQFITCLIRDWNWFSFAGNHQSTWKVEKQISDCRVRSISIKGNAKIIDLNSINSIAYKANEIVVPKFEYFSFFILGDSSKN